MFFLLQDGMKTDLAELGSHCVGERHDQIISRQKEALVELRTKLRALEKGRPAGMSVKI